MPAAMVPNPVPDAVANRAEAIKVMTVNSVPPTPMPAAIPATPAARPDSRRIREKTPAKSQHTTGMIASLLAMPAIIVSAYCRLFLAKKKATIKARKAGSHSAPSDIDPKWKVVSTISTRKITKGRKDIHAPP